MVYAAPGTQFEVSLNGAPTGLTGTIGVRILDTPADTVVLARTTTGIVEAPVLSGLYAVALTAPVTQGVYSVVWDWPDSPTAYAREEMTVTYDLPPAAVAVGPQYATVADLTAYVAYGGSATVPTGPAADRLLERAERDVDRVLGPYPVLGSGRKLDPAALTVPAREALRRATCAAAEYRLVYPESRLIEGQYGKIEGPDFSADGTLPRVAPKLLEELAGSGLLKVSGTVTTPA